MLVIKLTLKNGKIFFANENDYNGELELIDNIVDAFNYQINLRI